MTHLRHREDGEEATSVIFRRGQDYLRSLDGIVNTLNPWTTELLNRPAIGWSELMGSLVAFEDVLEEGGRLEVFNKVYVDKIRAVMEQYNVRENAKLLDIKHFPDMHRSQASLARAYQEAASFLAEFSGNDDLAKLLFLTKAGGACLIAGTHVANGVALISHPEIWCNKVPTDSRPSFEAWRGKPTSIGKATTFHASILMDSYEDSRRKHGGAPASTEASTPQSKLVLNFDSSPEEGKRKASSSPAFKKLKKCKIDEDSDADSQKDATEKKTIKEKKHKKKKGTDANDLEETDAMEETATVDTKGKKKDKKEKQKKKDKENFD